MELTDVPARVRDFCSRLIDGRLKCERSDRFTWRTHERVSEHVREILAGQRSLARVGVRPLLAASFSLRIIGAMNGRKR